MSATQSTSSAAFLPFGAYQQGGVSPQGFDVSQLAQQIAGHAAQALPGLIMGLLAAHPILGAQLRAQSAGPQGLSSQGFDPGHLAQQIAGQAAQALPGLIMSVLAANPTLGPQIRAQSAGLQGMSPQGLFNMGFQSPTGGGGFSLFGANPQAGLSPQGVDLGQLAQQIAGHAAQALPGLILGLLAAHPILGPQIRAQSAGLQGMSPQGLFNMGFQSPIGGGGFSLYGANPQGGLSPQGVDLGQLAQQIAGHTAQALPGLIMGILAAYPMLGAQMRAQTAWPQGGWQQGGWQQGAFNQGWQSPTGGGGSNPQAWMSPQGVDFGQLAQQIAGQAAQALPGLIMGLFAANPTLGSQLAAGQTPTGAATVH